MVRAAEGQSIVIASHYREGAIYAIARAAAHHDQLARFYTSIYTGGLVRRSRYIPSAALRGRVQLELSRRAYVGIPSKVVEVVVPLPELIRLAAYRVSVQQGVADYMNFEVKRRFDRAVASRLLAHHWDVVVAMFASAEETLRTARRLGRLGVLNFVNSHPVYQNRFLKELAGLHGDHHELVPPAIASRVDRELALANLVLVPSHFVARQLVELGISPTKVAVEPYGVDLSLFHPRPTEEQPVRGRLLRCLYVGSISHRKGITVLLKAARRLVGRPVEFVLMGMLHSAEVMRDVPPNVSWRGASVHDSVAEAMREADLFVLPSVEDAYPLVTMEAMASGLPVVISDHAGTCDVISDGTDGLIVPAGDAEALADAIDRVVEDPDLRRSMGAAARRRVETGHSWDAYGGRVLDLIAARRCATD